MRKNLKIVSYEIIHKKEVIDKRWTERKAYDYKIKAKFNIDNFLQKHDLVFFKDNLSQWMVEKVIDKDTVELLNVNTTPLELNNEDGKKEIQLDYVSLCQIK